MKLKPILYSFILIFSVFISQAADNGLWLEGKDHPEQKANLNAPALSPEIYLKVADKVNDTVVNISTTEVIKGTRGRRMGPDRDPNFPGGQSDPFFGDDFFERFFGQPFELPDQRRQSLGSGFILNSEGYIVTNNHVVERADEVRVVLNNSTQEFKAKVIGKDQKTDVALLKIEVGSKIKLKPVILGDSDKMKVGEIVIAIGNPFGLSHTVTQGIVSAKERSIGYGTYDNFIQTDASINPGNSGGPLLNIYGEVIGINSAIVASGQGIGFAIPINLAKGIISKLRSQGKVTRGWLGVLIQQISEEHASALKLPNLEGALVSDVQKDSPAQAAGLKAGDVIVSVDSKPIRKWNDLPMAVAEMPIGKTITVEVIRDGKRQTMPVKIGELKEDRLAAATPKQKARADQLGISVQNLTPELARSLGIEKDIKGVVVQDVDESKPAFEKGIRRGDLILEVNRKKVSTIQEYQSMVSKLKKGDSVLLLVKRGTATLFVAFPL